MRITSLLIVEIPPPSEGPMNRIFIEIPCYQSNIISVNSKKRVLGVVVLARRTREIGEFIAILPTYDMLH